MTSFEKDRLANWQMVQGFQDGYDLDAPEPGDNHSRSDRHGVNAGRNDRLPYGEGPFFGLSASQIRQMADDAMDRDETRH